MKRSGWSGIGIATILVMKLASFEMDNPQYSAGGWITALALVLIAVSAIYGGMWIVSKMRSPLPAAVYTRASANAGIPAACMRCNTLVQPKAKFCSECGTVAA